MKNLYTNLRFCFLFLCIVTSMLITAMEVSAQQRKEGTQYFGPISLYLYDSSLSRTERWEWRWGVGVDFTQITPTTVEVKVGWRRDTGFRPDIYLIPGAKCDPGMRDVFSNSASVTLGDGSVLSTANGGLSTTYYPSYGFDYYGTYEGSIDDIESANVNFDGGSDYISRCGNGQVYLSPSSFSIPLAYF